MEKSILCMAVTAASLYLISCEKQDLGLQEELSKLEERAAFAESRERQLELEIADSKLTESINTLAAERAEIEKQREEIEIENSKKSAAAMAELALRERELLATEQGLENRRAELDAENRRLTGLKEKLSKKELEQAGKEPIASFLPASGNDLGAPSGDFGDFYEPLRPYGSWFLTRAYGYVYQPTVGRKPSWHPYTQGRWAFTEQGWTWVSDEPFGWATYHYGRWALLENTGWVWVPGNEWAPAWVSWRESHDHIGWAPLPPETLAWKASRWGSGVDKAFGIHESWFSFVAYQHFGSRIKTHCVPRLHNGDIFRATKNVTRYTSRDQRVFVGGPRYDHVNRKIGSEFPIHRLRFERKSVSSGSVKRFNPSFEGRDLRMVAPHLREGWKDSSRPKEVRADRGDVKILRAVPLSADIRNHLELRRYEKIAENKQKSEKLKHVRAEEELKRAREIEEHRQKKIERDLREKKEEEFQRKVAARKLAQVKNAEAAKRKQEWQLKLQRERKAEDQRVKAEEEKRKKVKNAAEVAKLKQEEAAKAQWKKKAADQRAKADEEKRKKAKKAAEVKKAEEAKKEAQAQAKAAKRKQEDAVKAQREKKAADQRVKAEEEKRKKLVKEKIAENLREKLEAAERARLEKELADQRARWEKVKAAKKQAQAKAAKEEKRKLEEEALRAKKAKNK